MQEIWECGTSLGIVALATSLTLHGAVTNHFSQENIQERNAYENTILDRETILNDAKTALANIVLPNGGRDGFTVDFPSRDEYRNINSVQVNEQIRIDTSSVYRYISGHENNKNNPEIVNEFLDKLIAVAGTYTPSQKDLAKLQELTDKISEMNLALDGNNIIDLDEKDNDFER